VITKQLIADQSMQSIGDTIRYVPGVSVRRKNRSTTSRSS
jgi:outer membrane receptor for ferric coprogen and ferric-rhodotorulic acid